MKNGLGIPAMNDGSTSLCMRKIINWEIIFCGMTTEQSRTVAVTGSHLSGKSVLCGRLIAAMKSGPDSSLVNTTAMDADTVERYRILADKTKPEIALGYSNMTAYLPLRSACRSMELVVLPGSRKYWKWLDFGLSDCDGLVVVVRPKECGTVSVFEFIEPLAIGLSFGIESVLIVINNVDGLDSFVLDAVQKDIQRDLTRIFHDVSRVSAIPIVTVSDTLSDIHTLVGSLFQQFPPLPIIPSLPLQLSINDVRVVQSQLVVGGRIQTGSVSIGDSVMLQPAGIPLSVISIHVEGQKSVACAHAGQVAGLMLSGISKDHVSTGMAILDARWSECGSPTRQIEIEIHLFNNKVPFRVGSSPIISVMNCHVHSTVDFVDRTGGLLGDTLRCTVTLNKTVFVQVYDKTNPSPFSRVRLRFDNVIVAVGVVRAAVVIS